MTNMVLIGIIAFATLAIVVIIIAVREESQKK